MKTETKTYLKIGGGVLLLFLCIHYWENIEGFIGLAFSAAFPLLVGCIIAYMVNILMVWFEKRYFPRSQKKHVIASRRIVSLILAILTMLAIVALVTWLIVPELIDCFKTAASLVPPAANKILEFSQEHDLLSDDVIALFEDIDWKSKLSGILGVLTVGVGNVMDVVVNVVSRVFSGIVTGLLAIIFSLYLLLGKDRLSSQCERVMKRYMKKTWYEKTVYVLRILNDCFGKYIVGQCTEAVILGLLCTLGMLIFRFPYATMIGALIAFTALIPVAGAYIGGAIGAFMVLTVSPVKAVLFVVFLVILQQIEGNLIYPRVVGSSIGLPGIWVLAAVTVGGGVMGIFGMLLGVPIAAAIYRMLRDDINKAEPETNVPQAVTEGVTAAVEERCAEKSKEE